MSNKRSKVSLMDILVKIPQQALSCCYMGAEGEAIRRIISRLFIFLNYV
jgi:hypothetical protein